MEVDAIVIVIAGRRSSTRRRVRDTPAWVSDPRFALWSSMNWQPPRTAAAVHRRRSKRPRVDATSEITAMLQEVTGGSRSGEECAVCLQDFRSEETLRAMPCSHAFHDHCISQWLRRSAACPLCRHRLASAPAPEEEEEEEEQEQQDEQEQEQDQEEDELEWVDGAIGSESS